MQKYIDRKTASDVRYFEDDIDVSEYINKDEYRLMTDDEINRHENPIDFMTDEEKLALSRAEMPALTPKQLKLALALNNISEETVQTAINAIEDAKTKLIAQYEWGFALSFERTNPRTEMLAALVGLNAEQVDALWQTAATL